MKYYWKCEYIVYIPLATDRYEIWVQNDVEWKCLYINENGIGSDSVQRWGGISKGQPYRNQSVNNEYVWTRYDTWNDVVLDAI